jgi:hypothetical protein
LSCSELKNAINGRMLTELGELEQNLVYGDMGSAELIKFLQGELSPDLGCCRPACGLCWQAVASSMTGSRHACALACSP